MPAYNAIAPDKLARLVGTPAGPAIIDLRPDPEWLLPAALLRPADEVEAWSEALAGRHVVIACGEGRDLSHGVAAYLRTAGAGAEVLEGGARAWQDAGLPLIPAAKLPRRDTQRRTIWVTRARPKVDRIACPWLIRRFVDPDALFLFVAPSDVPAVADQFGAAPFDVDGVFWSHHADRCTFDAMVDELGLGGFRALLRLQAIVRGADTAQLELTPQSAGLLAASLGLSRIHADDLDQLEAGMGLYDAFYRWCRDAVDETHDPAAHRSRAGVHPPAD